MKVIGFVKNTIVRSMESIRNFRERPLDSLGQLLPVTMGLTAFIGFVVAYIMFIVSGGYTAQINMENGLGFTSGNVHSIIWGIGPIIVLVLLLVQCIVMVVTCFKRLSKFMKVIAIIDFGVWGISTGIISLLAFRGIRKNEIPESIFSIIVNFADIIMIVALVSFLVFLVFMCITNSIWMLGHGIAALMIAYGFFPLLLLALENIIPCAMVLFFAVLTIMGIYDETYKYIMVGGKTGNPRMDEARKRKINVTTLVLERDCAFVPPSYELCIVYDVPHSYVETSYGKKICRVKDLNEGKFHIYDSSTGKEITCSEIGLKT